MKPLSMKSVSMKSLAQVRSEVATRFDRNFATWVQSAGSAWPLVFSLSAPDENQALADFEATAHWAKSWLALGASTPATQVISVQRSWRTGSQRLPTQVAFSTPDAVAAFVGRAKEWNSAVDRLRGLQSDEKMSAPLDRRSFNKLVELSAPDWQRMQAFLLWVGTHPTSGLLPRQLPIPGVDSKWFEANRSLGEALWQARARSDGHGFGLRVLEKLLTIRVLDPQFRAQLGGLGDFSAEPGVIAGLQLKPQVVIICENLQCAYSFDDIPGAVLIAKQGYAVDVLSRLPWLARARILYWGDLDTHGFGILNRFRSYFPQAESMLMDTSTLRENRALWATEPQQNLHSLSLLTAPESAVLVQLRSGEFGQSVRLEQERIPWASVERALHALL